METSIVNAGVLFTGTNDERAAAQERLIKHRWELTFSPNEWNALSREEREEFLLKDLLSVVTMDLDKCLARNVDKFQIESDSKRIL